MDDKPGHGTVVVVIEYVCEVGAPKRRKKSIISGKDHRPDH